MTRTQQTMAALSALVATFGFSQTVAAEDCVFSTPNAGTTGCSTTVDLTPLPNHDPASGGSVEAPESGDPSAPVSDGSGPVSDGSLPVTGSETLIIVVAGAGLVTTGALMVMRTRAAAPA